MLYKNAYCFTAIDLFDNFNRNKVKISNDTLRKKYKCNQKEQLFAQVLTYCFYLIVKDIIENNITFDLPLFGSRQANIYVKQFDGEKFKNMYRKGCFMGIDYLNSNFKGYQMYFQYDYKGGMREKPLYINSELKDQFYENINNGKQYY